MLKVITEAGNEHEVSFCGISSMSGLLVISIKRVKSLVFYAVEFSAPKNTATLTYMEGISQQAEPEFVITGQTDYVGYTELVTISHNAQADEILIMLAKTKG